MTTLTLDQIFEEFADLDRSEQTQYLMELGYDLPPFPEWARTDENRVHGCQSQVWLITGIQGTGEAATFTIQADSDSNIIKGLLAILQAAYNGKTAREILRYDILSVFKTLDLQHHITPQRRNGLRGMVDRIQTLAQQHLLRSTDAAEATTQATQPTAVAKPAPSCAVPMTRPPVVPSAALATSVVSSAEALTGFDVLAIRRQFPVLNRPLPSGRLPVYLDSAASAQKPAVVIDKEREVEEQYFANAHRGTYQFGLRIDEEFEGARSTIAQFLNAPADTSIVFTPGTTIGLNMVAMGWGRKFVQAGDEVLISVMEHHANFVPWQQLAKERGAVLKLIPLTDDGQLDLDRLDDVLTRRTRLVAVSGMSNMLGTVNPIRELTARARDVGACVVVDAAQSVPHLPCDVQADDVDFLVFSGHKIYGPTGIGVLYGKPERLDEMNPVFFGGHMIQQVAVEESTWSAVPAKFEAGTMPIVQAIALGTAIRWVQNIGLSALHAHEYRLVTAAMQRLQQIPGMTIYGPDASRRGGIVTFRLKSIHPEDLAALLDHRDIFTRHGHHCTMPLHSWLGVSATTRISFGAYSTLEDVDTVCQAIEEMVAR